MTHSRNGDRGPTTITIMEVVEVTTATEIEVKATVVTPATVDMAVSSLHQALVLARRCLHQLQHLAHQALKEVIMLPNMPNITPRRPRKGEIHTQPMADTKIT